MLDLPVNSIKNYLSVKDNVDYINRKVYIVEMSVGKMNGLTEFMDKNDIIN
jgi:hypothetical protein